MAVVEELVARLGYEMTGQDALNRWRRGLDGAAAGARALAGVAAKAGIAVAGMAVTGVGLATKNSIAWEQALTDLNAPLNASKDALAALGEQLTGLSENMPVARTALAELAGGFARTGIAAEDLAGYAELAAKASVAWEMGAAQTGDVMAELANVYKLNKDGLEGLADTVNHLANNYATTGEKLTLFLSRASAAAGMLGMTDDEIAGIGAGLTAMGIRASTAGDAMTKMATQIMGDGPGVAETLEAMGTSLADMQAAFLSDGPEAFLDIFERIAELPVAEQTEAIKALFGQEYTDDFGKVVNNIDLMREAMADATDEQAKLGSVTQEYEGQIGTIGSKWQLLKNRITSAGDEVGGPMSQKLHGILDTANEFMGVWNDTGNISAAIEALNLPPEVADALQRVSGAFSRISASAKAIAATDAFKGLADGLKSLSGLAIDGVVAIVDGLAASFEGLDAMIDKVEAKLGRNKVEQARMAPEFHQGRDDYLRTLEDARVQTNERYNSEKIDQALASLSALSTNLAGNLPGGEAPTQEILNDSRDQSSHVQVSVTQNVALTEASTAAAGAVAQATGSASAAAATPARSQKAPAR